MPRRARRWRRSVRARTRLRSENGGPEASAENAATRDLSVGLQGHRAGLITGIEHVPRGMSTVARPALPKGESSLLFFGESRHQCHSSIHPADLPNYRERACSDRARGPRNAERGWNVRDAARGSVGKESRECQVETRGPSSENRAAAREQGVDLRGVDRDDDAPVAEIRIQLSSVAVADEDTVRSSADGRRAADDESAARQPDKGGSHIGGAGGDVGRGHPVKRRTTA